MANFIELTSTNDEKVLINVDTITGVQSGSENGRCSVSVSGGMVNFYLVKETYEEVKAKIENIVW